MKTFQRSILFVLCLALAFGAWSAAPAGALEAAQSQAPAPEGLSEADWGQIRALLPRGAIFTSQGAYLKASNTGAGDWFGHSVAVSGDTVVVGTEQEDSSATGVNGNQNLNDANDSGAVYVFTRSGTTWSHNQNLNDANDSGAVYVFTRSGTTWSQQAYLKASNTDRNDRFGASVAIDGDTVVVGAGGEDSSATGVNGDETNNGASGTGAAYVFTRSGDTWSQQAYLKASNTGADDYFGVTVAIDGDTVVVGAYGEDSSATGVNGNEGLNDANSSGAAYVFTRSGTDWSQQAYLKASNTEAFDLFGDPVAISGDTIVVGAIYEDSSATGVNGDDSLNDADASGAAYVFTRSGDTWTQQAYLKASNTGASDWFGEQVAVSGDTVVVGANGEDSSATGVNGNQTLNNAEYSGAAYVFTRSGTTWSQGAYLKASNTGADDAFGISVAVSGDTIVVGADLEDSSATGVNGDQSNNDAASSGAGYVFDTRELIVIDHDSLAAYDGWVLEKNEDSIKGGMLNKGLATITLGDSANDQQYRAILHFDTSALPDNAVLTKATLSIKRHSLAGTNPFTTHGQIVIDSPSGAFYANPALQAVDFQAIPDMKYAGTSPNTPAAGAWYSGELKAADSLQYINLTGTTQLRLRFLKDDNDDMGADVIRFYSGNHAEPKYHPMLAIEYYIPYGRRLTGFVIVFSMGRCLSSSR